MREVKVDLRKAADKKQAISLIYNALGFQQEAGLNLDALEDVLSAWFEDVRIHMLYWKGFARRQPAAAEGLRAVLDDITVANRCIAVAYCKRGMNIFRKG